MGALETNTTLIYGVHIRESANDGSDFTNAAADYRVLFLGEDGLLHVKDSAGSVTSPYSAGNAFSQTLIRRTTTQTVTSGVETAISFDTETEDTDGAWAIGTPTKIVIPSALNNRRAILFGGCIFPADTTGNYRQLRIATGAPAALTPDAVFIIPDMATNTTSLAIQVQTAGAVTLATSAEYTLLMRMDATIGVTSAYFGFHTVA